MSCVKIIALLRQEKVAQNGDPESKFLSHFPHFLKKKKKSIFSKEKVLAVHMKTIFLGGGGGYSCTEISLYRLNY